MRNTTGQLAECIEPLRFRKLPLHLFELELRVTPLGDVARDLGKADQFAVLAYGIDDDAGPEEGAVLADAPAFFLVAALLEGNAEGSAGFAIGPIGLGVELREVPAQDLFGGIALDPFTAGIPAGDEAGRVQHVERVVGDTFNEEAKIPLAFE